MTPNLSKIARSSVKPRELLFSASTNAGCLSPTCLSYDGCESMPSPTAWSGLEQMDDEKETCLALSPQGCPPPAPKYPAPCVTGEPQGLPPAPVLPPSANQAAALAAARLAHTQMPPSPSGLRSPLSPSAMKSAGEVPPPWLPEPPCDPPQLNSPSAAHLSAAAPWPKTAPPSVAPSVWPWSTSPTAPAMALGLGLPPDASQRLPPRPLLGGHAVGYPLSEVPRSPAGAHQSPILSVSAPVSPQGQHQQPMLPQPPPPQPFYHAPAFSHFAPEAPPPMLPVPGGSAWREEAMLEAEVQGLLAILCGMRAGSSPAPLPPSGCYGSLHISSALSDGLGPEAAEAAVAAAKELGERPVKVLLPWYPTHAGISMFDQTKPAKVPILSR